ncbi:antitoxin of toxin-antitoxin stability system [Nocardiopsis lambiniae]|uniref:Antitoxin of toxin-antitoxin stability system n=1 Tax=Nocardiopsis lambiniae TaxID=3075539 RepID=A0ABU2MGR6_9ACTN|nr:antitoxin of toxin-antitoxin stability system [Nocardiopsis sp. DSM 44743]MDT0331898.1 antitoxin of toxin-antitoxin stability system [Nocardiopsis sp. DSM 44743]
MDIEPVELSVAEARDRFSQRVNRAAFGDEITYVTRGRNHERVAAIVPIYLVEAYEELLDQRDGGIAHQRLEEIRSGDAEVVSAEDVARGLGL